MCDCYIWAELIAKDGKGLSSHLLSFLLETFMMLRTQQS